MIENLRWDQKLIFEDRSIYRDRKLILIGITNPGCCAPYIFAHHCDFMWTSCLFRTKTCGEKIAVEHIDTAPFVSIRSASSVESFADTGGKNCNV